MQRHHPLHHVYQFAYYHGCILEGDSHFINGLNSEMMKKVGMGEFKPKSKGMENTTKDKWNMGKTTQVMSHAHALGPRNERMRAQ